MAALQATDNSALQNTRRMSAGGDNALRGEQRTSPHVPCSSRSGHMFSRGTDRPRDTWHMARKRHVASTAGNAAMRRVGAAARPPRRSPARVYGCNTAGVLAYDAHAAKNIAATLVL